MKTSPLPLAGALAVARVSVPAAALLLGWLLGYVVVKGAADVATVESGSYWRLIMPALPAFAILSASVPLLVPTFLGRMGTRLAPLPGRRPGLRGSVAFVAVVGLVPIVVLLARVYRERRLDLDSLGDRWRGVLYGALGVIVLAMAARDRLVETGGGTLLWIAALGVASYSLYLVWRQYREYA